MIQRVRIDVGEERLQVIVRGNAERAQERRGRHLALPIDFHPDHVVRVSLELEPRAAIRDELRAVVPAAARDLGREERAGGTDELGHHDALDPVDHERSPIGHNREFAQVHLLLLRFARALVHELRLHAERGLVVDVFLLRCLFVEFGIIKKIVGERELEVAADEVLDRRNLIQELADSFFEEPAVALLLDLDQIRKRHGVS